MLKNNLTLSERFYYSLQRGRGVRIEVNLARYLELVERIRNVDLASETDIELKQRSSRLRSRALTGESLDMLLVEAFALCAEVERRTLRQDPHDVQLVAGIALHQGKLAQMRTGEGKTLAAVAPAYLNSLCGGGVHVMTANEYLAHRDALWMGEVYRFLGLSVGYVREEMSDSEKKRAYLSDVTYLTARQGGFDFLTDQVQYDRPAIVQRSCRMAIVDEADFILIDEARIPLVIAAAFATDAPEPPEIDRVVRLLRKGEDFVIDRQGRNCTLTLEGQHRIAVLLGCGGMHEEAYRNTYAAVHVGLHAHYLLTRDVDYIVRNGTIELVDSFTGRIADRRRWPYGIQRALEAKEGTDVHPEGRICGSITIQNFVGRYEKLAAMTATAVSAADEFMKFYGLATVVVPPYRKDLSVRETDLLFSNRQAKLQALVEEVDRVHRTGRPILVGTASVRESEELFALLEEKGIDCVVLNARNDEAEAELISRAGMLGAVTISTNMAGRGTDIVLGGEAGTSRERVQALGGLYVIGTNRHESVRIDDQLRGRAGRQGDPGSSRFFVSLEDDLIRNYAILDFIPKQYLQSTSGAMIRDRRAVREIERAQSIIEHQHFEIRHTLRRYSQLVEAERRYVELLRYEALFRHKLPDEVTVPCGRRCPAIRDGLRKELVVDLLIRTFLSRIDAFWSDHLALVDELREGIHLQRYAGADPLLAFLRFAGDAFEEGLARAFAETVETFSSAELDEAGGYSESPRLQGPAGTWTYLINDNPLPFFGVGAVAGNNIGTAVAAAAVVLIRAVSRFLSSVVVVARGLVTSGRRESSR